MVPPNETDDGFAQGPGVADAPQGPELQVAGEDGAAPSKVTLDLDDAPFMQEPEPEKEPEKAAKPEAGAAAGDAAPEDEKPKKSKKKLFIIAGAAVALIVILAAVYFLFLRGGADEPPPPPPPEPPKPEVIVVPSKPKVQVTPDVVKSLEPFVVPHADASGVPRFLYCKFSFVSKNPALGQEVDSKLVALRDAVFFYLKSKDTEYLMDARNAATIKKEVRGVVSDYLTKVKLEDVLLDSYLNE